MDLYIEQETSGPTVSKNIHLTGMLAFFPLQKRKTGFRKMSKKKSKMIQNEETMAKVKDVAIINE